MGYWKSKVLPKIKKVFQKDSSKKATAAEACKSFVASKEEITKELEEKKTELQPKVVEIYGAATAEIKSLVKEPKDSGLRKHSTLVLKFLEELVKIDFPGSKPVSEACSKYGAADISGPVAFVFEKVSTFVVEAQAVEPTPTAKATGEEESSNKGKEIVVEDEKKEEAAAVAETEKTEPLSSEPAPPAAAAYEKTESVQSVAAPVEEAESPKAA